MIERKGLISFNDQDVSVIGADAEVGARALEFTVTGLDWKDIKGLAASKDKVRIICSVVSLETSVCDRETQRFNREATALSEDIVVMVISTDLPFTQERWCGAAGIERVMVLSDHKHTDFGQKYACLMKEPRLLRRAVFIIDKQDIIRYVEYLPALSDEPDYERIIEMAKNIIAD